MTGRSLIACVLIALWLTCPASAATAVDPGGWSASPPPDVTAALDRATAVEGDAVRISVNGRDRCAEAVVSGPGGTFGLYPDGRGLAGWVAVPLGTPAGNHRLLVTAVTADGRSVRLELPLEVTVGVFPEQRLIATQEMLQLSSDTQRVAADRREILRAYATTSGDLLWDRPFDTMPVAGRISTEFGHRRYVNERLRGFHYGVDIAAAAGTLVTAANDGRVVLAADLLLQGNTVIIDHGQGLHSLYYHLTSYCVSPGQTVRRGQEIGRVGSTGFSTGPHLHWGVTAHSVPVNPWMFGAPIRPVSPHSPTGDRP